jgi:flagellar biosynthetic protein FliR
MELSTWLELANGRFVTGLLVFVRFVTLLAVMPMFSSKVIPAKVKTGLALTMALVVTPLVPAAPVDGFLLLMAASVKEAAVGLVMGWIAGLVLSCVQMAGEWLDLQGGFQAGSQLNPMFETQNAPVGNFANMLAGLVFFGCGGHGLVIRAAVSSMEVTPPGVMRLDLATSGAWTAMVGKVFWIAVQIAAPVAAAIFLMEIAIALANKALPQVNVMILTLPVKALVTVSCVALSIPLIARVLEGTFSGIGADLASLIR